MINGKWRMNTGGLGSSRPSTLHPSPQPSPPSTRERGAEKASSILPPLVRQLHRFYDHPLKPSRVPVMLDFDIVVINVADFRFVQFRVECFGVRMILESRRRVRPE